MTKSIKSSSDGDFDFGGRLSRAFPSQIIMDITEVCNLACVHCPHPTFKQSHHYGARYLPEALNKKMIDEVRENGIGHTKYIRYTSNGEPLVHPNSYDMIEDAVVRSGVFVTLTTNGTIMNEKRTRRLLEAGVHMIDISLDAFKPETYKKIRVNGDLNKTAENVHKLISLVDELHSETKVVVSFVEQPENAAEVNLFERYWKDSGASSVVIRRLHTHSGAVEELASARRIEDSAEERYPCLYPWERVTINASGKIAFCPSDWVHGSEITDFSSHTIKDVWSGKFYQELRSAHKQNRFDCHGFCGQCPDWKATRWPSQGRSYADLVEEMGEV